MLLRLIRASLVQPGSATANRPGGPDAQRKKPNVAAYCG